MFVNCCQLQLLIRQMEWQEMRNYIFKKVCCVFLAISYFEIHSLCEPPLPVTEQHVRVTLKVVSLIFV